MATVRAELRQVLPESAGPRNWLVYVDGLVDRASGWAEVLEADTPGPGNPHNAGGLYADSPGFMTLVSDGERLTGAYALGQEAGEWLQQATVAIRARVPLTTLFDVIQPFPSFSEAFLSTLTELEAQT
jgi:pyridine nucleotide-disulfide oxidoreductase